MEKTTTRKNIDAQPEITLDYLLAGETRLRRIVLAYHEYMDENYADGDVDADVPRFADPLEYIAEPDRQKTVYFSLQVQIFPKKLLERVERFYWNGQENDVALSQTFIDGALKESSVICSRRERAAPFLYEIARFDSTPDKLILNFWKDRGDEREGENGEHWGANLTLADFIPPPDAFSE